MVDKLQRPIFPCRPGQKKPAVKWKDEATTDKDRILALLDDSRGFNFAVKTGDGLVVIDCDSPEARREFQTRFGRIKTFTVQTPRGVHIYYRLPEGVEARNSVSQLGEGIDVRGDGGYALIPPSEVDGTEYAIEGDLNRRVMLVPPDVARALFDRKGPGERSKSTVGESAKRKVVEGHRNDHLTSLAGSMRHRGMTEAAMAAALDVENQAQCNPPLPPAEVRKIAASVATYPPAAEEPPHPAESTDGNGRSRNPHPAPAEGDEEALPPLRVATVEEVLADRLPDTRCERIVHEGITTLLVSLAKQGKTYLACQLALSLASGESFLGLEIHRSRVLYMSWEITLAGLLTRMRNVARDCNLPDPEPLLREGWLRFYAHRRDASVAPLNLGESRDWPRLRQLMDDEGTEVLFIDTLRKACPDIELKDDRGWSHALGNFNALARERGHAQVLIDHGHRGRAGETAAAFAMGSQVKGSELPCLLKLDRTRKEGEPDRWKVEVESWFDDPGTAIWYERPEDANGIRGCGCVLCDAPPGATLKGDTTLEMESWLEDRLTSASVASTAIYTEAAEEWPALAGDTLKRKLRRALEAIGGTSEEIKGAKVRQTLWGLGQTPNRTV